MFIVWKLARQGVRIVLLSENIRMMLGFCSGKI
ncbi:Hypothetical protein PAU_04039 [Photorhabdus asymbiotica]|uniref:Uncharacterized protein n=1 Tax=Photorhabdus asymbiotica subsp. asymbiotica (strain ATCC 43949 / 3105-77) TaxID=553480 RepID=B6VLI2_PHOAA|nr:Hypothetical protein PAU_04039 [Photorhabdus asymbiotica]CAR67012.1 Hypothetical protein PA-RVA8-2889 [Photorhabdus asymbiotica subsp. asymbiotica ATCC 43949]